MYDVCFFSGQRYEIKSETAKSKVNGYSAPDISGKNYENAHVEPCKQTKYPGGRKVLRNIYN